MQHGRGLSCQVTGSYRKSAKHLQRKQLTVSTRLLEVDGQNVCSVPTRLLSELLQGEEDTEVELQLMRYSEQAVKPYKLTLTRRRLVNGKAALPPKRVSPNQVSPGRTFLSDGKFGHELHPAPAEVRTRGVEFFNINPLQQRSKTSFVV